MRNLLCFVRRERENHVLWVGVSFVYRRSPSLCIIRGEGNSPVGLFHESAGVCIYSSIFGFSTSNRESSGEEPAMRSTSLSIFFNSLFEEL